MNAAPSLIVVMGVSGSGKSTLARALAERHGLVYLDADDFHSDEARARMAAGLPLGDAMRAPWAAAIAAELGRRHARGERVALAFSGLRRAHRDVLRATGVPLAFLFLCGGQATIAARIRARHGHYMPVSLLDSQFETLEDPRGEPDVIPVDIDAPFTDVLADAERALGWLVT